MACAGVHFGRALLCAGASSARTFAVVRRATDVLAELERDGNSPTQRAARSDAVSQPSGPVQLTLFGAPHAAVERLKALEVDTLSPLDALQALYELKRLADA